MPTRIRITFLILVLIQALHSVEEYFGRLWKVFPPATFLYSLVSKNYEKGFIIINIGLFIFGMGYRLLFMRRDHLFARGIIWFWVVIEMINGIIHPGWALYERGYVPGVATAPFLLIFAVYLCRQLLQLDSTLTERKKETITNKKISITP